MFVCTGYDKTVQPWTENGADPYKMRTVANESRVVRGETLPDLIKNLSSYFGIDIDDLFAPDDGDGVLPFVGFNQVEDDDGNADPAGKWLADYSFTVVKTEPLTVADLKASGLKHH